MALKHVGSGPNATYVLNLQLTNALSAVPGPNCTGVVLLALEGGGEGGGEFPRVAGGHLTMVFG